MHRFWNNSFNEMTHFNSNWFFLLGILRFIITLGIVVAAIVVVVIMINKNKKGQQSAVDILKQRYASGEISEQEYKDRLKVLND